MTETTAAKTPTLRTDTFDRDSLVVTITDKLAERRDVDPLELPPLHEHVDVDALVSLLDASGGAGGALESVTFTVEDQEVHVEHDGSVRLRNV